MLNEPDFDTAVNKKSVCLTLFRSRFKRFFSAHWVQVKLFLFL